MDTESMEKEIDQIVKDFSKGMKEQSNIVVTDEQADLVVAALLARDDGASSSSGKSVKERLTLAVKIVGVGGQCVSKGLLKDGATRFVKACELLVEMTDAPSGDGQTDDLRKSTMVKALDSLAAIEIVDLGAIPKAFTRKQRRACVHNLKGLGYSLLSKASALRKQAIQFEEEGDLVRARATYDASLDYFMEYGTSNEAVKKTVVSVMDKVEALPRQTE